CAIVIPPTAVATETRARARRRIDYLPLCCLACNAITTYEGPADCVDSTARGDWMPGGLVALLDDVAALARLAAASVDDITAAASRAGAKAAGVVIDDAAVTPKYVVGLSPQRELPIIYKI